MASSNHCYFISPSFLFGFILLLHLSGSILKVVLTFQFVSSSWSNRFARNTHKLNSHIQEQQQLQQHNRISFHFFLVGIVLVVASWCLRSSAELNWFCWVLNDSNAFACLMMVTRSKYSVKVNVCIKIDNY